MTDPLTLPDGQETFKLNEVCKLANVQPYMLRFWGTELPQLEAQKTGTGQRVYGRDQVELILELRRLLFDEGLTMPGAKRRLVALDTDKQAKVTAKPPRSSTRRAGEVVGLVPVDEAPPPASRPPEQVVARAEVDKLAQERVQPLLATLRQIREELSQIVASLEAGS